MWEVTCTGTCVVRAGSRTGAGHHAGHGHIPGRIDIVARPQVEEQRRVGKKTTVAASNAQAREVEDQFDNRPRKVLDYRTPAGVFVSTCPPPCRVTASLIHRAP